MSIIWVRIPEPAKRPALSSDSIKANNKVIDDIIDALGDVMTTTTKQPLDLDAIRRRAEEASRTSEPFHYDLADDVLALLDMQRADQEYISRQNEQMAELMVERDRLADDKTMLWGQLQQARERGDLLAADAIEHLSSQVKEDCEVRLRAEAKLKVAVDALRRLADSYDVAGAVARDALASIRDARS